MVWVRMPQILKLDHYLHMVVELVVSAVQDHMVELKVSALHQQKKEEEMIGLIIKHNILMVQAMTHTLKRQKI